MAVGVAAFPERPSRMLPSFFKKSRSNFGVNDGPRPAAMVNCVAWARHRDGNWRGRLDLWTLEGV
jgi:hypothetical protein